MERTYYVYVLLCEDESLYTGITTNIVRRLCEHVSKSPQAARYTRSHTVCDLVGLWRLEGRSLASALEWRIHHASKAQKLRLLEAPELLHEEAEPLSSAERLAIWKQVQERTQQ